MRLHEIIVSDPMFFVGPDNGNILAKGIGIVHGQKPPNWQEEDYLLEVLHPFEIDGEEVRYLLVSPRYSGDRIKDAINSECIVGICRLKPGISLSEGNSYSQKDVEYWAIGSIKRFRV